MERMQWLFSKPPPLTHPLLYFARCFDWHRRNTQHSLFFFFFLFFFAFFRFLLLSSLDVASVMGGVQEASSIFTAQKKKGYVLPKRKKDCGCDTEIPAPELRLMEGGRTWIGRYVGHKTTIAEA